MTYSGPPGTGCDTGLDPRVAHPARVYAYWLGGKDHYPADRKAAEEVIRLRPQVVAGARANRAFLARVVGYLAAGRGIGQFLDIGTGLPAPNATHQVAQAANPGARVVYVDNDPLVMTHARALLTSTPQGRCGYVQADLRDPSGIVARAARTLDFTQPVAVLLLAVLHFLPDADCPAGVVAALAGAAAPGSCLAISHLTADFAPQQVAAAASAYNASTPVPVTPRSHAQVTGLFGGLPLLPPGVVPVTEWRPRPRQPVGQPADLYAGLARIPPVRPPVTTSVPAATAALERLDAALDPGEFATTLTTGAGRPPRLAVASRRARIGGDIHADHAAYWWSWSERIAPITDPPAAADKIASILRAIPAARR